MGFPPSAWPPSSDYGSPDTKYLVPRKADPLGPGSSGEPPFSETVGMDDFDDFFEKEERKVRFEKKGTVITDKLSKWLMLNANVSHSSLGTP